MIRRWLSLCLRCLLVWRLSNVDAYEFSLVLQVSAIGSVTRWLFSSAQVFVCDRIASDSRRLHNGYESGQSSDAYDDCAQAVVGRLLWSGEDHAYQENMTTDGCKLHYYQPE